MKKRFASSVLVFAVAFGFGVTTPAVDRPDSGLSWIGRIRPDHPRLFFNAQNWPLIKEGALTIHLKHYRSIKAYADDPSPEPEYSVIERPAPAVGSSVEIRDWGLKILASAFVCRIEPGPRRLLDIQEKLLASIAYYKACFAAGKPVSWYGMGRLGCLAALDWLWNRFSPDERRTLGMALLDHLEESYSRTEIMYHNLGGYKTGFYGDDMVAFYAGLVLHNEGIDDRRALRFLQQGYEEHMRLLRHRAGSAGDDGGGASATLGYLLGEYPVAEWNFFYAFEAATGIDIAQDWAEYVSLLLDYIDWNRLPGDLEYGYGDTPHIHNRFPSDALFNHMSHFIQFYGATRPDRASLAARIRSRFPQEYSANPRWAIQPFLLTRRWNLHPPDETRQSPLARHFETMGQVFMRSGDGPDDTYALFACGGILEQHRHYDANHFTIFRRGFLALDSGTRAGNTDNLQNYFAQTIAHNCILVKMPGESPSPYWNGKVFRQAGGQDKILGSRVLAFETSPLFTYVAGDATPVYNEKKCSLMARQFVFIPPDRFVIFDRVVSRDAGYRKTWLIHTANEPVLCGGTWRAEQGDGRIFCRTLLPKDAAIEKIGGPGKEFLVEGINYRIDAGPSQERIDNQFKVEKTAFAQVPELMGRWRMEVSPGAARLQDLFLHIIQTGDCSLEKMGDSRLSLAGDQVTVELDCGDRDVRLSFAHSGDVSGHIRIRQSGKSCLDKDLIRHVIPQKGPASNP